jgi:hypothetical protein
LRRRAVQFHYHQLGAVWGDLDAHQRLFHFADGSYAGCTIPHPPGPDEPATQGGYVYRAGLERRIVPVDPID